MRYRYYFCERNNQELISFLNYANIPYKVSGRGTFIELVSFNLWSDVANTHIYMDILGEMRVGPPIVYSDYTIEEIAGAKALWILPKKQCIDIEDEQNDTFVIAKEPSIKTKTAFWAEDTGFSELFTDCRVYELVEQYQLTGVELKNVLLKKGLTSKKIYRIISSNIIKKENISIGHGEKIKQQDTNGKEQYIINSSYQLHVDFSKIEQYSDLYVTDAIFGPGVSFPLYVISQHFYQLLKEHNLDGGLTVCPVADISLQ